MTAYIIGLSTVRDLEGMNQYRQSIPATLSQYGGRLAVRGMVEDVLEGALHPHSVVVFEFDSADDARRWYDSPEYQKIRELRQRSAESAILLVSPPGQ